MIRINRFVLSLMLAITLVLGVVLGTSLTSFQPVRVQSQDIVDQQSALLQKLYVDVNPSVVAIDVRVPPDSTILDLLPTDPSQEGTPSPHDKLPNLAASGSGFVWDDQGHIITNAHVVMDAVSIRVNFSDGGSVLADLVGYDVDSDLAVIKIDPAKSSKLIPLMLADSSQLQVGQRAIAFGNPFDNPGTMTQGIISALNRSLLGRVTGDNRASYRIPNVIQTDAAINPGNSGGPLVNIQGQVVGVTTAIWSQVRQSSGVGYAVPANIIKKVVPKLISAGKAEHSYLGLSGRTITMEAAEAMGMSSDLRGVLVEEVSNNGPAEQAGLLAGKQELTISDLERPWVVGGDIIVGIDDQPVRIFEDLLGYLFVNTEPGQTVTLKIIRNGQPMDLTVTLGTRPTN